MDKYLEFSVDYEGQCEDFQYMEGDIDKSDEIDDDQVTKFVEELSEKVDGFMLSEHRTQGWVNWYDDGTMDLSFRYFNEPEDGEFDDYELFDVNYVQLKK